MNLPLISKKERLVFPIVRVDDRLLHGQVVVGWGQTLGLAPLLLASDRVSKDSALRSTFQQLLPEEMRGEVVTTTEAALRWVKGDFKNTRAMLVLENPVDVLKMVNLGAPIKVLTLGGLHYREGREEFLPYIYLSEWERKTLLELRNLGVRVICQDLPVTKPVPYEE